jgi:hypothetical protein
VSRDEVADNGDSLASWSSVKCLSPETNGVVSQAEAFTRVVLSFICSLDQALTVRPAAPYMMIILAEGTINGVCRILSRKTLASFPSSTLQHVKHA